MTCSGRVVAVQVPLFGGTSDDAWFIAPTGPSYSVKQGASGAQQTPAVNALRYLKQKARPFLVDGCPSWLLTAVQAAPSTTDLVSQHVARYLAVGALGDTEGGWGTFGPLGSVGGALASESPISLDLDAATAGLLQQLGGSPITGTIGVDVVDLSQEDQVFQLQSPAAADTGLVTTGTLAGDMPLVFRNVVALPAICCPNFPLPVDAGWTLALRLAGDAGLGAIVGRDVVLTLAGMMPGGCGAQCACKARGA